MNTGEMTRLEFLRRKAGLSLRDIAQKTGTSICTVHRIEKGLPSKPRTVRAVAACLGAPLSMFNISAARLGRPPKKKNK